MDVKFVPVSEQSIRFYYNETDVISLFKALREAVSTEANFAGLLGIVVCHSDSF